MRKLFLTFVMALLCNVVSFAQSGIIQISSAEDFLKIGKNGGYNAGSSFQQTADIDLGAFTKDTAIIPTFSGTYDGNGYSITYQASFTADNNDEKLGLFGTVTGTIKNLNLTNCSMTASSEGEYTANIALLCAYLNGANALVTDCKVVNGEIRSTIMAGQAFARVATGMLVGHLKNGKVEYSSADGVVVGMGYVGGLVGQSSAGKVTGSSFSGDVTATFNGAGLLDWAGDTWGTGRGGYAGGIVGFANEGSTIQFCYVNADITAPDMPTGVGGTNIAGAYPGFLGMQPTGKPTVTNNYCEGTINGNTLLAKNITNSAGNTATNYFPDGSYTNGGSVIELTPDEIASALNTAVGNSNYDEDKIQFSSEDDNVIFGVVIDEDEDQTCGVPTNLVVSNNAGNITASWDVATAGEGIIVANTWKYMLSGGDLTQVYHGTATTNTTPSSTLPGSQNPYTLTVYTDCSATVNGLTSDAVSQTFTVPCPIPTNLQASNITDNGFTISWTANVDCQLTVNGIDYEILAGNPMTKQITGLEPETQYTAIVRAKCGNDYVEQASINVTTARLYAPTGLAVTTGWNGSAGDNGGSATISWTTIEGLTYEVNTENNTQTSPYQISNTLPQASYTAKVRAKKGDKYSDWASIPYTVSTPNAPSNPIVTYQHTAGEKFNVSISWTPGTEPNSGWEIKLNGVTIGPEVTTNSRVITNQNAGSASIVQIIEKVGEHSTSKPLNVPIQVPCLDASEPTSIVPALNSVTFNFADAKTRKIFIGSREEDANATSVTIDGLTEGTSYAYEIREYCNVETNTYSSISSTFSTLACYAVAGLSVSNVELTTATVSWTSQSSIDGLKYKVVVNEGEPIVQTAKTINLTGLTQSTEYTVEVYEQCGAVGNWGAVSSITFTTKGTKNYISATSGDFTTGTTWIGGKAPNSADLDGTTITISQGHTLTLSSAFTIDERYTVTNNGVLVIQQGGELINTTSNNVGGIIEVVTPIKDQKNWHFVGAPFAGYKLEAIKPVNGSDVAITTFNYTTDQWHSSDTEGDEQWATYETWINKGEGYFAWQFYDGAMRFTTYGDLWVWDTETTGHNGSYNFNQPPLYKLNNDDVITFTESGNWIALANPYPFKLNVATFLNDQTGVQGGVRYKYNNDNKTFTTSTSGEIGVTEGFFVNFIGNVEHEVKFKKTQRDAPSAKANAEREFIRLALVQGKREVELLFAQNEDAEQGYDIYDANKLFSPMGVAEPYFVTDGIALIKEEVRDLPYYATMNVRSQEDTVMNFVLTNLPEGYAVSIIDGEEVIDLVEGGVYSTEIASGENADRFKVLVKKNVGLADVEELDVRITNSNRHITITAQENVRTEVYNTLGQKIFETEETNFVLSGVASGAYVVKVQGAKASKSQKIVVE